MKLTREQILALPAGRDLDKAVAEHVMGQAWQGGNPIPGYDGRWPWPPPYSTDVAAALAVAEKVAARSWHLSGFRGGYRCQIVLAQCLTKCFEAEADTAPLAVCRAALFAVLEESP